MEGEGGVEEREEAKYTYYCGLEKLSSYFLPSAVGNTALSAGGGFVRTQRTSPGWIRMCNVGNNWNIWVLLPNRVRGAREQYIAPDFLYKNRVVMHSSSGLPNRIGLLDVQVQVLRTAAWKSDNDKQHMNTVTNFTISAALQHNNNTFNDG